MDNEENANKRYAAIEITSKSVKLVYGYVQDGLVYVLHALQSNVNALEGGVVVESDALTAAIKGVVNAVNETLNIHISEVLLALPPIGMAFTSEHTLTRTISPDSVIVPLDINNCITQLFKTRVNDDMKVVDAVPYQYVLENGETTSEAPINKLSPSLDVYGTIYSMDKQLVNGYIKAIENAGLKIKKLVAAPFANALYLTDCDQVSANGTSYYLLNIGSDITTLNQINQKTIISQSKCFRFGSDKITEKLMEKFNLSFKDATMLKEKYGIDKSPSFKVNVFNGLTMDDIGQCCQETILPLINSIKNQISTWSNNDNRYLPIVLTGGGTSLYGLKELLEQQLSLTVIDVTPYSFGARNKSYENCLGLIKYADKYLQQESDNPLATSTISRVAPREGRRQESQDYNINEEL